MTVLQDDSGARISFRKPAGVEGTKQYGGCRGSNREGKARLVCGSGVMEISFGVSCRWRQDEAIWQGSRVDV